ncbi:MAG: PIN domain-containing protein [Nitrospinota bacterium]|nr:MAG: PIN domain-containing protein [Nitrospinota bacterium]
MYLVDTNIWLERLLDQERSEEVGRFLAQIPSERLCITDFTFHSLGVILSRLHQAEALLQFVRDAFIEGAVSLVGLLPENMETVVNTMQQFRLDFDDAYQYVAAERFGLTLISFDQDFDRTPRGRNTPAQIQV